MSKNVAITIYEFSGEIVSVRKSSMSPDRYISVEGDVFVGESLAEAKATAIEYAQGEIAILEAGIENIRALKKRDIQK